MPTFTNKQEAAAYMNTLGAQREPFVFLINYDCDEIIISRESEATFDYDFNGITNARRTQAPVQSLRFGYSEMSYDEYREMYDDIYRALQRGDSYLINLTAATPVTCNWSLSDVFAATQAKYRVHLPERFTCFSPETFVTITDGTISSYPMKGTIDATLPDAEVTILSNQKEMAEHSTMVDLIRNDLSIICDRVWLDRFRYITRVAGQDKELLQVSSKIDGNLPEDYVERIGDILFSLLPAGSITGAPKRKTVNIINAVERDNRGFYTGICGRFDGINMDSGVMIRMISQDESGKMSYHSGGGITYSSNAHEEYKELIQKIYVPISRDHQDNQWRNTQSQPSQRSTEQVQ